MSDNSTPQGDTRRDFLRKAAIGVAAGATSASVMPTTAAAMQRVIGANDRIQIGHVGLGGQGMTHVRLLKQNAQDNLKNNTESIAVCDLYVRRKKQAQQFLGLDDAAAYDDYRRLVDRPDLDCVWVTTSDQWHADVAMAAMESGKHVYCEKPMCKTVDQAYAMHATAKRTKRVVQVGVQACTDLKWHVAGDAVKSGRIGHTVMGQGSYCRNSKEGEWNYYTIDPDASPHATGDGYVNWDLFRRGVEPAAWDPDRFFRWRKYWEYGSGILGDLFPHRLHPLMIALAQPQDGFEGFPIHVASLGGLYVQKINPVTHKPDREVPDFTNIIVDMKDECSIMLLGTVINEIGWQDMVRGNKATIYFGGDGVEIKPERIWSDEVEGGVLPVGGPGEDIAAHERNFLDAVRTNGIPNCNIDLGLRVQIMISLGELSYRHRKEYSFDAETRRVSS